jgi:hypothetical protein
MFMLALSLLACSSASPDDSGAPVTDVTLPALVINEFLAMNAAVEPPDAVGEYDDWIELWNAGDTAVSFDGLHISDDEAQPDRWPLPADVSLEPGGFYLLWADGQPEQGPDHVGFKLSGAGEAIVLSLVTTDGAAQVDAVTFESQAPDTSMARHPDGSLDWRAGTPTPGASNGD